MPDRRLLDLLCLVAVPALAVVTLVCAAWSLAFAAGAALTGRPLLGVPAALLLAVAAGCWRALTPRSDPGDVVGRQAQRAAHQDRRQAAAQRRHAA